MSRSSRRGNLSGLPVPARGLTGGLTDRMKSFAELATGKVKARMKVEG